MLPFQGVEVVADDGVGFLAEPPEDVDVAALDEEGGVAGEEGFEEDVVLLEAGDLVRVGDGALDGGLGAFVEGREIAEGDGLAVPLTLFLPFTFAFALTLTLPLVFFFLSLFQVDRRFFRPNNCFFFAVLLRGYILHRRVFLHQTRLLDLLINHFHLAQLPFHPPSTGIRLLQLLHLILLQHFDETVNNSVLVEGDPRECGDGFVVVADLFGDGVPGECSLEVLFRGEGGGFCYFCHVLVEDIEVVEVQGLFLLVFDLEINE